MPARVAITRDRSDIAAAIAGALDALPIEEIVRGRFVATKAYGERLTFEHE